MIRTLKIRQRSAAAALRHMRTTRFWQGPGDREPAVVDPGVENDGTVQSGILGNPDRCSDT